MRTSVDVFYELVQPTWIELVRFWNNMLKHILAQNRITYMSVINLTFNVVSYTETKLTTIRLFLPLTFVEVLIPNNYNYILSEFLSFLDIPLESTRYKHNVTFCFSSKVIMFWSILEFSVINFVASGKSEVLGTRRSF